MTMMKIRMIVNEAKDDNDKDEENGKHVDLKRLNLPSSRLHLKLSFPSSFLCLPAASPCTKNVSNAWIMKHKFVKHMK